MKKIFVKFLSIIILATILLLPESETLAARLSNLRSGNYDDKTRIVLAADTIPQYGVQVEGTQIIFVFNSKVFKRETVRTKDPAIKNVYLEPYEDKSRLVVNFHKAIPKYKVFNLKNPNRIVIDFNKINANKFIREIEPGFTYTFSREYIGASPVRTHVLSVAQDGGHLIKPILGDGTLIHKGRLTKAAKISGAKAAINASYFDSEVWVIGNLIIDKKWISEDKTPRTALIVDEENKADIITNVGYSGSVTRKDGKSSDITGMNRMRLSNEIIYYNDAYDSRTFTNAHGIELRVENGTVTEINKTGNSILRPNTIVLSGHGTGADFLRKIKVGEKVIISQSLKRSEADNAKHVVGAGPLLVLGGKSHVETQRENIASDIAFGRAPRTAVGIKKDGTILFVVVDGRSRDSIGMTLSELAKFMIKIGSDKAMNFDGGGSSEMVLGGKILNTPSDGGERPIRVGLGVF